MLCLTYFSSTLYVVLISVKPAYQNIFAPMHLYMNHHRYMYTANGFGTMSAIVLFDNILDVVLTDV